MALLEVRDLSRHFGGLGQALVNQRQIGLHTASWARGLSAVLREDPDVIAIGELQDAETITLALEAAESGRLVLATLNAPGATEAVNHLVSSAPAVDRPRVCALLSQCLRAVISQRLLPRSTGKGRVPAVELLAVNGSVAHMLREGKGLKPEWKRILDDYLVNLLKARDLVAEETMAKAIDNAEKVEKGSGEGLSREVEEWYARADEDKIQDQAYQLTFQSWTDEDWDEFNDFYLEYVEKL